MKALPPRIARPVMYHHWNWIAFLHWRYPPAIVQRLLPPVLPAMPWLSRFGEINVRTYVHDGHGRSGIWFFSLDAARLPAVAAARAGYWLPYFWSDVSVRVTGGQLGYRCRRRRPGRGARCDAEVTMGLPLAEAERDEAALFLTARYRLFTMVAGRLAVAEAEHPPWPLHRAEVLGLDQDLLQRTGLPAPTGDPLAHASPGVPVRVGVWHW